MKAPAPLRPNAFTLIELLFVISIIALLAGLLFPAVGRITDHADTIKCVNNLRQIGASVNLYAADHNNTLPTIETAPENPIYPEDVKAKPIAEVLGPYGISDAVLKCPADLKARLNFGEGDKGQGKSFFEEKKTSYEWRPLFDGELVNAPKIYTPRGAFNVPMNRVRLLLDYCVAGEAPHARVEGVSSSYNSLQADGSVRTQTLFKADAKR